MSEDSGSGAAKEILVRGRRLLSGPTPGVTNKFVITEAEAWFLPLEKGEVAPPTLAEMLLAIFGEALEDEEFVDDADARLEDGRLLLGYMREGGAIEIHSLLDAPDPAARARIREVFGREFGMVGDDPVGEDARPGPEGKR
ncbi:MAG: hypothetical protein M3R38_20270 [Actinomycetota bacterium]|nr:hypothetical protein [Actinomycetota bacterium]